MGEAAAVAVVVGSFLYVTLEEVKDRQRLCDSHSKGFLSPCHHPHQRLTIDDSD